MGGLAIWTPGTAVDRDRTLRTTAPKSPKFLRTLTDSFLERQLFLVGGEHARPRGQSWHFLETTPHKWGQWGLVQTPEATLEGNDFLVGTLGPVKGEQHHSKD